MSTAAARALANQNSLRVEQLRSEFDQSFALAPNDDSEPFVSLIAIRIAGESFVLRPEEVSGLTKAKHIVPLPSSISELIGVSGIRGALVPVFSLGKFLGLDCSTERAHWLALASCGQLIGLAFDEFEGQVEVERKAIYTERDSAEPTSMRLLARVGSSVHPVIQVPQILEGIRKKAAQLERKANSSR